MSWFDPERASASSSIGSGVFEQITPDRLAAARGKTRVDLEAETRRMIEQEREAARQQGAQMGFAEGHAEGYAAGVEQGRQEAYAQYLEELRQELAVLRGDLEKAFGQIEVATEQFYASAELQMAAMTARFAERVLEHELRTQPDAILDLIRAALREVVSAREVRIRLNPFHSERLQAERETILREFSSLRGIEIVDDPEMDLGCVVESDHGVVDARLQTTFTLLEEDAA